MATGGRRRTGRQASGPAEPSGGRRGDEPGRPGADALREVLAPALVGRDVVVEKVDVAGSGRRLVVRVTVDRDDGPGSLEADELADVSRAISAALDEADPVAGEYTLEVSTPGVSRPLTEPRHWRRAVGRLVTVRMRDGGRLAGRVLDVTLDGVVTVVLDDGRTLDIDMDAVEKARVEVEFAAADAEDRTEKKPGDGRGGDARPAPGRGVHGGH